MSPKTTQITAALWDFGGVFTVSPFVGLNQYARDLNVDPSTLRELVFGPYHQDTDHPWHKLERGEQSLKQTSEEISSLAKKSDITGFTLDGFFQSMRPKLAANQSAKSSSPEAPLSDKNPHDRSIVVAAARQLKTQGIGQAIVTNNIKEFADAWRTMIPVDEIFEQVVDSSKEGMRKPNPAIYQLALERLGNVPPAQAVFLDDAEGNVKAAQDLGIKSILVKTDPTSALQELSALTGIRLDAQ